MTDRPIEPAEVVRAVDEYVDAEIRDSARFSNRKPLDESGVYSLHMVAARIYAEGFQSGEQAATARADAERRRAKETTK